MTFTPYVAPDEDGMVKCQSWDDYCPLCWDDLWWIAKTRKTVCRGCGRYTEEHIGKVDLKHNPLEEDKLPDFLSDPRFTWVQDGHAWVGTRWNRDGTRHVDIKTGKPSTPWKVVCISGEKISSILNRAKQP